MRFRLIFAIIILLAAILANRFLHTKNAATQIASLEFSPEPLSNSTTIVEEAILGDGTGGLSVGLARKSAIGTEFFVLVAAQLDSPQKDSFYEAWMVKRLGREVDVLSLGKMERSGEAKIWQAVFRASSSISPDYGEVWVSIEQKDDNSPERVLLKGVF